jgi:hypothetical protein
VAVVDQTVPQAPFLLVMVDLVAVAIEGQQILV